VGDVHANARALRAALATLRARAPDRIVFLGDLLTYGADVDEVLDLVAGEVDRGAGLALGNHDRLYRDLLAGERTYYDALPDWIRESVDHMLDRLAASPSALARFQSLPYAAVIREGPVWISHANPFDADSAGTPDWRYLARPEDMALAAHALRTKGATAGVFGHTHRARIVSWPDGRGLGDEAPAPLVGWRPAGTSDALIVNAGAVGQPRSVSARSTVAWIAIHGDPDAPTIDAEIVGLDYDVRGHLAALAALPVSARTRERLAAFFRPQG
jgi:predicted phosphodiesterase